MPNIRSTVILALLAFIPGQAFAHGEGVLLFPLGTLAALVAVLLVAFMSKLRWLACVLVGISALAASLPFWFVHGPSTDCGYFLIGLFPSLAAGALAIWLSCRKGAVHNGA